MGPKSRYVGYTIALTNDLHQYQIITYAITLILDIYRIWECGKITEECLSRWPDAGDERGSDPHKIACQSITSSFLLLRYVVRHL